MPKKWPHKKVLLVVLAIFIFVAILIFKSLFTTDAPSYILRSLGYQVETKDATFRGFASQIISANKDGQQLNLQIVKGVGKDLSNGILKDLVKPVESIQHNVVITDPYSGRQTELKIPDKVKPVRKKLTVNNGSLTYYVVYVNEIFSLKIFSEKEAKYKGIFTTYYCPGENAAFSLGIFSNINGFDENGMINLIHSLFCK